MAGRNKTTIDKNQRHIKPNLQPKVYCMLGCASLIYDVWFINFHDLYLDYMSITR